MITIIKMIGWKKYYYNRYDFLRDIFQPINSILFIASGIVYGNLERIGAGLLQLLTIPLLPFKISFSLAATVATKIANRNQDAKIFKLKDELIYSYEILDTDEKSESELYQHERTSTARTLQALNEYQVIDDEENSVEEKEQELKATSTETDSKVSEKGENKSYESKKLNKIMNFGRHWKNIHRYKNAIEEASANAKLDDVLAISSKNKTKI